MSQGLIMMERSMKGAEVTYVESSSTSTQSATSSSRVSNEQLISRQFYQQTTTSSSYTTSLKGIIEKKAIDNNLTFLPVSGKFKDGKQVYVFGKLNIYLEGNVVYVLLNGTWRPSSISEILQNAI